jgi:hypothetical protein
MPAQDRWRTASSAVLGCRSWQDREQRFPHVSSIEDFDATNLVVNEVENDHSLL